MTESPHPIESLFAAAVALTPQERLAFLEQQCAGDAALRERLVALLRAHDRAGHLLDRPPTDDRRLAATTATESEQVGNVIAGRYKLLEELGEGGMGTVWVAEQIEPVKRRVALKLIKPGMDTRQVLSRFEAERQALALMDHPNIARVFDGGMTAEGRPFFVMEYVKGLPLNQYCDETRLSVPERLALFAKVCQAVQHAHQKGIIHRDLKPSNILVCLYDGQPVPKVIDFGLAKAMHRPLTERTLYTAHGLMVGTPLYMSPEQAEFNNLDIDTRSDIYSLGVILYELLTGTTPLERKQFKEAAWQEMLRLIKEQEPPPPSTRLSGSGSLPTLAAQRSLDPAQLRRLVRGELDWIVMKSLEKERSRRYETANGLARDIERHLRGDPVEAGPPSATYRWRKLANKHRGLLTTAAAFIALLVVGTGVSTWQAIRATRAERVAKISEENARSAAESMRIAHARALEAGIAEQKAKEAAQAAAVTEAEAKEAALAREQETDAILAFVENKILAAARPEGMAGGLGYDITLRQALDAALPYIDQSFPKQPLIEARLRTTIGRSFALLRDPSTALSQHQAAYELLLRHLGPTHPRTLSSRHHLGLAYAGVGRHADALEFRQTTVALCKATFGPDARNTLGAMNNLATSYSAVGKHTEALQLHRETLAIKVKKLGRDDPSTLSSMDNLSDTLFAVNQHAEALKLREETLALRRYKLGPHLDTFTSMEVLAKSYAKFARHADAIRLRAEALEGHKTKLGPDHFRTLRSMTDLAHSYAAAGRHADALTLREDTLKLRLAKLGPDHEQTLLSMGHLADSYQQAARHQDAQKLREEILQRRQATLGRDHRVTLRAMDALVSTLVKGGNLTAAEAMARECVERSRQSLGEDDPFTLYVMDALGRIYLDQEAPAKAEPLAIHILATFRRVRGNQHPKTSEAVRFLARVYGDLGKSREATPLLFDFLAEERAIATGDSLRLAAALHILGNNLVLEQRYSEAEPYLRECLAIRAEKLPNDWRTYNSQSNLGASLLGQKKYAEAEPHLLQGYAGMASEKRHILSGNAIQIPESLQRLVALYEAWEKPDEAAKWRKILAAHQAATTVPADRSEIPQ
jgi:serine/threonine protein kinase